MSPAPGRPRLPITSALIAGIESPRDRLSGIVETEQHFDSLLRRIEACLRLLGQAHAALEEIDRLLEGKIASLQLLHDLAERGNRCFEVERCGDGFRRFSRAGRFLVCHGAHPYHRAGRESRRRQIRGASIAAAPADSGHLVGSS